MKRILSIAALSVLVACDDNMPKCDIISRRDFPSPDGKHVAVAFQLCCYDTTGTYPQASLLRKGEKLRAPGNLTPVSGPEFDDYSAVWIGSTNLIVQDPFRTNSLPPTNIDGVTVTFRYKPRLQ